jgi:hypothetical protein
MSQIDETGTALVPTPYLSGSSTTQGSTKTTGGLGLGSTGSQVSAFQTQLNNQNAGKPGWTPLLVDGIYGPKTQAGAAYKPTSALVVTSDPARSEYTKYSGNLDSLLAQYKLGQGTPTTKTTGESATEPAYSDAFTQAIDKQMLTSNDATKALLGSIQSKNQAKRVELAGQYDNYKRGLQLLGIQHNDAQATPELLLGHEMQAQNDYSSKINALDVEEHKTLVDAQAARDEKDTSLLKQKMDYIKQIKKDKEDAAKTLYEKLHAETQIATDQAHTIYTQLSKMSPDKKQAYIQEVSAQYNIPLQKLVTALADEAKKAAKVSTKSSSAYSWGSPVASDRSTVEKYLQANSDNFNADLEKIKGNQQFFYYVLNQAENQ